MGTILFADPTRKNRSKLFDTFWPFQSWGIGMLMKVWLRVRLKSHTGSGVRVRVTVRLQSAFRGQGSGMGQGPGLGRVRQGGAQTRLLRFFFHFRFWQTVRFCVCVSFSPGDFIQEKFNSKKNPDSALISPQSRQFCTNYFVIFALFLSKKLHFFNAKCPLRQKVYIPGSF